VPVDSDGGNRRRFLVATEGGAQAGLVAPAAQVGYAHLAGRALARPADFPYEDAEIQTPAL